MKFTEDKNWPQTDRTMDRPTDRPTNQQNDRLKDRRTHPLIEMRGRISEPNSRLTGNYGYIEVILEHRDECGYGKNDDSASKKTESGNFAQVFRSKNGRLKSPIGNSPNTATKAQQNAAFKERIIDS